MARLNRLKGSTMIEAVVASVIFLVVFGASLDIITRVSVNHKDDDYIVVEVDNCIDMTMARYASGDYGVGVYESNFTWGKITTTIDRYEDYGSILQIVVRAEITNSHRRISYRRLIEILDR